MTTSMRVAVVYVGHLIVCEGLVGCLEMSHLGVQWLSLLHQGFHVTNPQSDDDDPAAISQKSQCKTKLHHAVTAEIRSAGPAQLWE